jgi:hypothetical protein
MNNLKIPLSIPPRETELQKKETFYKVLAGVIFTIGLIIILARFNVFTSLVFLFFSFVSFRLAASGQADFLKVMDNSYLYIDDERLTLHRSRYAFQKGELTLDNTIFWTRVKELHIGMDAIDVVHNNGEHRHIDMDMLPATRLREVLESLYEIKAKYNL